jgi:transcriptional regulator of acetoin/glycerol metabolism
MVRSLVIVVGDDQSLIQKAQQFAQSNGISVQVMSPEQWEGQQSRSETPSLVSGHSSSDSAKVLPFPGSSSSGSSKDGRTSVATINQLESVAIENAISAFRGNLTEAAKALGIGRATLYRKVKQYKIDPANARKKKAA